MHLTLCKVATLAAVGLTSVGTVTAEQVLPAFDSKPAGEADKAFEDVYNKFLSEFPADQHDDLIRSLDLSSFLERARQCPSSGSVALPSKVSAYPGGATKRVFGMDMAKLVAAGDNNGAAMAIQGLQTGSGMIKAAMSTILMFLPKAVTGQNAPCLPMATGHNCFGAVLHPITASDFVLADTTDSMLDGVIAGFPSLYKRKVGTTSDAAYKACFSAMMSMQCASLFPKCGPARDQVDRIPMCATHCLATLVACPGFWINDISDECQDISVPPMCSFATFTNYWLLPPQYTSYEDSLAGPASCPEVSFMKTPQLTSIYDDTQILASPYQG